MNENKSDDKGGIRRDLPEDPDQPSEVTELEEGDLEDVSGGAISGTEPNTNCNNTSCCG